MQNETDDALPCQIVDESTTITQGQLCRSCGVHAEWITVLVEEGVLEPAPVGKRRRWVFAATEIARVHTALRLQRDLGLNVSGIALALDLMEQNRALRERLEALGARGPGQKAMRR